MMEPRKQSAPFVNIGSSSLLVIFLVLCLVTFATLSLSSAKNDYAFSQKLAGRRTTYYTACNQAEEIVDAIDTVLSSTYKDSHGTYYSTARKRLLGLTGNGVPKDAGLELKFNTDKPTVSYVVPINAKQELSVILELTAPNNTSEGFYKMKQWKVVNTKKWSGDDTLRLIK